ncbi:phage terminase large subunit [Kingella sp. (in: b-proteobacteria)]|uniref:phage terminase large subunit n=1 Tax=Kingella sp. (in: b-proteobacteria) TaxID=2020713 RepID=UPI0026DA7B97|nr:phage terminase large subunit [Kingella sp. (in: b-proteobacteria)]MDO4656814.1 phage terminase large subunit [Kingella sp. (in: b-proteobacteria)]
MKLKEFTQSLKQLAAQLQRTIEAEVMGFANDPAAIAERRARVFDTVGGFEFFVNTYFPHYVRSPHKSQLHEYLFFRLPEMLNSPKNEQDGIAAPRGEAKSTLVTQLFTLWCIVTNRKHYILLVMDSIDQAYPMLEAIKAELEFNPRLAMDFADVCGQGRVWQAGTVVTANDIKVQVAGSGKKLRGLRHGAFRPDLVVLDDIENDEQVRNPAQRDKLEIWLKSSVLHLGGVGQKFDVVYIGTILHYDSVLNRTLHNPMWHSAKFKAMLAFPERMDLWDEWEAILRNNGNAGAAMAQAFYEANKAEMERGAQTSWAARGVLDLMKIRARDEHEAFDSELQNDPVSSENAPFANAMKFWTELPPDLVYFGALDPSLGKAGASRDPSAILVGGYQRSTGKLFVVAAQIKKRLPDLIIEDVIRLHQQYRCALWFVETVQFQEFLKDELVKRSAARGYPVPARAVKPIADKLLRIETLQPHMANGLIWLHDTQATLIEQLRHFPKAAHDDGPDALQMLWAGATSNAAPIEWHSTADDDFDDREWKSKWAR